MEGEIDLSIHAVATLLLVALLAALVLIVIRLSEFGLDILIDAAFTVIKYILTITVTSLTVFTNRVLAKKLKGVY